MEPFDQLAIYTNNIEESIADLSAAGFDSWTRDTVTAEAVVKMEHVHFQAALAFNYDIIAGLEFEFIQPMTDTHYIKELGIKPGEVAHMGIHVSDREHTDLLRDRWQMVQNVQCSRTTHHENPAVPAHRRYLYDIWVTTVFPFPVKTIERLEVA